MTMAQHEMRNHTVVRVLGVPGFRSIYRYAYGEMATGALDVRHLGRSDNYVTHEWERQATVDRPVVRVTPLGRAWRIGYNIDGRFHVEAIA
ncbi:hypothetical protein I544_0943 [Mycobacteroides abscessus subsp. bolletii 103]|nr:hypothetical protein I544_0943 [Mycobacteroides abscessus subsp. bolletii 103]